MTMSDEAVGKGESAGEGIASAMGRVEDWANLSHFEHHESVSEWIGKLIVTRGYDSAINELVAAVFELGEISLADPDNTDKLRRFDVWAFAVRSAIAKHDDQSEFHHQITDEDRQLASKMGIALE